MDSLLKQSINAPLYPDMLWDKPENRQHAGKLLIIGGNAHSFAAPASAYQSAVKTGIGVAKVLLPDALKKVIGQVLEAGEYAASTKSGSFARASLAEWLDFGMWADGVLLAGDFGRNSETAIVIEQFIAKFNGPVTITHDGLDYFLQNAVRLLDRPNTAIVASFAQLQKLAVNAKFNQAFTYDMVLRAMVENLQAFTQAHQLSLIVKHNGILFVADQGRVSTTPERQDKQIWRVSTAAAASVWTLQNPNKVFEALTCAVYELQ